MWVKVTHAGPEPGVYIGRLENEPLVPDFDDLHYGSEIAFSWFHVIDVHDGETLTGVWFVSFENGDYMGALYTTETGAKFKYRFRYYKDDLVFNSTDEKHWYQVDFPLGADPIQICREVVENLAHAEKSAVDEVLLKNDDDEAFVKELESRPWAHVEASA